MSKVISLSVKLHCGADKAFEMFTDNPMLESWLCDKADVEAHVGGRFELHWNPPPENNGTVGCRINAIERDRFLAFDWRGPKMFDDFMNKADQLTHVVVFFIPETESYTSVHLIHTGWGSSQDWDAAREWFDRTWGEALRVLQNRLDK